MLRLFSLEPGSPERIGTRPRLRASLILLMAFLAWGWQPMNQGSRHGSAAGGASFCTNTSIKTALAAGKPWRPGWKVDAHSLVSALRFVLDLDAPARASWPSMAPPPSPHAWALSTNLTGVSDQI